MKLRTDYLGYDCAIFVYNGMVSNIICDLDNKPKGSFLAQPEAYFLMQPKDRAELKYYKLPQEKINGTYKYNYKLEYENQGGNTSIINIKLSKYKLTCLKAQKKEYWIQKTDNWMKFIIPIITGVIVYLITRSVYSC
jgi:hypothetical protein